MRGRMIGEVIGVPDEGAQSGRPQGLRPKLRRTPRTARASCWEELTRTYTFK